MLTIIYRIACALALLLAPASHAHATIHVFACEPEWAALAREMGAEAVDVFSATTARQNPHHIRAKPSLIAAMRRADLVVCSGASLEAGWLPLLQQKAGTANTQPGAVGFLQASDWLPMLEIPPRLDRADGDVHPQGNPHVHLNPHHIARMAQELVVRLKTLDPAHAQAYQTRYEDFRTRWQQAIRRWESEAASLKGMPVVVHHRSFSYLINWLGMKEVGSLEPKPGIPPTSSHLESLLQALKDRPARMILRTPYESAEAGDWLADKTGIPVQVLPYTVGGDDASGNLFSLFDQTIAQLKEAQHAKR